MQLYAIKFTMGLNLHLCNGKLGNEPDLCMPSSAFCFLVDKVDSELAVVAQQFISHP